MLPEGVAIGAGAILAWLAILLWSNRSAHRRLWPPEAGTYITAACDWGLTILIYVGTIRAAGSAPLELPPLLRWGLGGSLSLAGSVLHTWATLRLGLKTTSGWPADVVTIGPYALCRHPQYLGQCAMLIGLALLLVDGWSLAVAFAGSATLIYAAVTEDRFLADRHPEAHKVWRARTRFLL